MDHTPPISPRTPPPISSLLVTPPAPMRNNNKQQRWRLLHLMDKAMKKSEILLEEYRRIENTPEAINAERKRKIRILMSFR
ncbi:hypothetical protein P8452_52340 [Trifolium repens]|jgi:hypothetical protein|nr:hypothetical protein P8452_52340 [Trifolium repens]